MAVSPKSPLTAQPASAVSGVGVWAVSKRCAWVVSRAVSRWCVWAVSGVSVLVRACLCSLWTLALRRVPLALRWALGPEVAADAIVSFEPLGLKVGPLALSGAP